MGRNPKIRLNFDSDVQYLLRMKHSLEDDKGYPKEFRDYVCSRLVELTRVLMTAPPKLGSVPVVEAETPKRRRAAK